jgi:hypothetical protein
MNGTPLNIESSDSRRSQNSNIFCRMGKKGAKKRRFPRSRLSGQKKIIIGLLHNIERLKCFFVKSKSHQNEKNKSDL